MCPSIYARKGIKAAVISQPVKEVVFYHLLSNCHSSDTYIGSRYIYGQMLSMSGTLIKDLRVWSTHS